MTNILTMNCTAWLEVRKKVLTRLSTCLPLGALVVVPFLTENYGSIYVLMALPITTLTSYFIDVCGVRKSKIINDWFCLLLRVCLLSASSQALSLAVKTMSHGSGLDILERLFRHSTLPVMSSFVILLVAIMFVLGLDRSGLLRQLITMSTLGVIFLLLYFSIKLNDSSFVDRKKQALEDGWSQIIFIAGVLVCSFSGTGLVKGQIESVRKYSEITITVLLLCLIMYSAVATCLCMLDTNSMISVVDEVPLLKLFNHRQMWRTEVIIYCLMVTGLSLSLPEIMSSAVSSVVGLASHACVIPVLFARESIFTSTHLHAIVLISCTALVLNIFCPYDQLIFVASSIVLLNSIVSSGYLICGQYMSLYRSTSVFIISDRVKLGGATKTGHQYQTLSMNPVHSTSTENLVGSSTNQDEDSGQGSDTDIDAAVEEFRDQVMIVKELPMKGKVKPEAWKSPVLTGENVYLKFLPLGALILCLVAAGIFMFHQTYTLLSLVLFSEGCLTCLLLTQPIEYQLEGENKSLPQWVLVLSSTLSVILLSQLVLHVWYILCIWTMIGLFLYWRMKQKSSKQFQKRQRVRLESIPDHQVIASYLTANSAMGGIDEVIIATK
ncbi:uncharacterized protein LOC103507026 isoform X1 [Diaphorina citri]|uniref:Uncharacterized protein LOC103507026 isoform X1 n=1 Tax=Diaphorina citri TaxID=121845 RepID=A0A1S3CXC9_DIACI|nr:uncharacterized protein LOC103507026 isoform X1 [Diaphorina citri]XP_026677790.1 uncharacterized protein LOC103507026 isoform X2 [Diaphorina citri]XP_026677791.1 uncharacterized protein LOC103507026 isoform X1 [Diaphorina citri]XP_026677792.1 uncharacterized protein LOC103507026 isoform X1 [Diaphorina citri]XP_026677793.1 uncharacterized protein LOC103507026 isoform X1 [Diaphorina citri]XP_026677794.1 uncharacterized protein LOC103507026 isoform X1 [Diaphorina citri]XP_026677795.1 uncharac